MAGKPVDHASDGPSGGPVISDHGISEIGGLGVATAAPSSPRTLDDAAVVRAVLAGDRDGFRILVDRELSGVVRTAQRIVGDGDEAEDIAQETFVIAYRSLATWRAEGPFGAWLARIAVRLAVRRASQRRVVPWTQPGPVEGDDAPTLALRSPDGDPEQLAVRGEQARDLRRAVAALDEPYREVVALRFFADRSLDEIAALTGRPLGTVKTHLRRGLIRLRTGLPGGAA
jgi:RNA polymerase sigma-70 factor (ECF subfamily)